MATDHLELQEQQERRKRREAFRRSEVRYSIERDPMPKWKLWETTYRMLGAYEDCYIKEEYDEMLSLLDSQVSDVLEGDTPRSRAEEIELSINFPILLEYAKHKQKVLSKEVKSIQKRIENIDKQVKSIKELCNGG